ncbi:MAG: adenylate/guanylate cyclase domain-containing protein [Alphaproteobacteria bacterium]|jgi:adenylate cyclase|nr:adenylate/guanylate cyclase domain-containing protein [Alphaproteobacteria bacterium]MBT4083853.1 adenylate/guanylate cyclase domain-containing protein [Alphaproteobacteria bacterium]MBT4546155.1 adenylate/guanylate cyclase domain-containing protein [Alphaproteobacteria bacterium]
MMANDHSGAIPANPTDFVGNENVLRIFKQEERNGQRLALKGRIYTLIPIAILLLFVTPIPDVFYFHGLITVFGVLGVLGYFWQRHPAFKGWHQRIFATADFALLTSILVIPNPLATLDYPPQLTYHLNNSIYLYVVLMGLAFSYRPATVIFGGIAGAVCWGLGLVWMLSLPDTLSILNVDEAKLIADPFMYLSNIKFIDLGVRLQEVVVFLVCAGLVATIVMRSRRLVYRQAMAEQDRHFVREALGKYVPASVANAIINDRGALEPQRQTATMLFADIEGFTGMVERMDPADVLAMLNAYFSKVGKVIVEEGGVINQFQGDAVLATFNLPIEDPDHAGAAIRAAQKIRSAAEQHEFAGHKLDCRVGIATGEVVAGSVGSGQQLAYTVHGDAVNLAARLEQMNKETDTRILISESTIAASTAEFDSRLIGEIPIRGRANAKVYTI